VANVRREELRRATTILGIAHQEFLGYRDSGMAGTESNQHPECFHKANLDQAAGRLVKLRGWRIEDRQPFYPLSSILYLLSSQLHL
jgi:LmbE family N-acetylglucosaminyl deacetylase